MRNVSLPLCWRRSAVPHCMGRSDGKRNAPLQYQTPCSPFRGLRRSGGTRRGTARHKRQAASLRSVLWVRIWIRGSFSSNHISVVFSCLVSPVLMQLSFLRPCYAIGAFFGCFPRLLTWGKLRILTIKTAQTGNVSSGRLLSQDFCFFRLLTVRRRKTQTVGKYQFSAACRENVSVAVVVEKQLRNNGLPVSLCRDNSVRFGRWGGCSFLFCQ